MINVLAFIEVKEGEIENYLPILKANLANVLNEKGCVEYQATQDIDVNNDIQVLNENIVTIIEKWQSLEDLQAHSVAPHMKKYQQDVKDMVLNVSLKILQEVQ